MCDIYEDLLEEKEDIEEMFEDINSGNDEDDYADLLEDLFEMVKEKLIEGDDD